MKAETLADELEALIETIGGAGGLLVKNKAMIELAKSAPDLLSALRRVEKLEATCNDCLQVRAEGTRGALVDVAAERSRQITAEGWAPAHDDARSDFRLSRAASCYAMSPSWRANGHMPAPISWPWAYKWWKPKNDRADLVRAGALIIAEIERLDRRQALTGEA